MMTFCLLHFGVNVPDDDPDRLPTLSQNNTKGRLRFSLVSEPAKKNASNIPLLEASSFVHHSTGAVLLLCLCQRHIKFLLGFSV